MLGTARLRFGFPWDVAVPALGTPKFWGSPQPCNMCNMCNMAMRHSSVTPIFPDLLCPIADGFMRCPSISLGRAELHPEDGWGCMGSLWWHVVGGFTAVPSWSSAAPAAFRTLNSAQGSSTALLGPCWEESPGHSKQLPVPSAHLGMGMPWDGAGWHGWAAATALPGLSRAGLSNLKAIKAIISASSGLAPGCGEAATTDHALDAAGPRTRLSPRLLPPVPWGSALQNPAAIHTSSGCPALGLSPSGPRGCPIPWGCHVVVATQSHTKLPPLLAPWLQGSAH